MLRRVRACGRAQEMPITGQSNKIKTKTKRNLGLRVNSYATLFSKMRTSVCTSSPHRSVSECAGTRTVAPPPPPPTRTHSEREGCSCHPEPLLALREYEPTKIIKQKKKSDSSRDEFQVFMKWFCHGPGAISKRQTGARSSLVQMESVGARSPSRG